MAVRKIGQQTIQFQNPPKVISAYSIAGPKEGQGPLKNWFDEVLKDDMCQEKTFEKAEGKMLKNAGEAHSFKQIDINKDGSISKKEFILHEKMHHKQSCVTFG